MTLEGSSGTGGTVPALPAITTEGGRSFITVPLDLYMSLLALAGLGGLGLLPRPEAPAPKTGRRRTHRLSRMDKDREVRAFVMAQIGTEDVQTIRLAAIRKFGAARVPGRTSFATFAQRVRGEAVAHV